MQHLFCNGAFFYELIFLCWMGLGVVFCPFFAAKVANFLGVISSFGGTPAIVVGWIIGFFIGLLAGPVIGIYHLVIAVTSNSEP